jgi:hypothetical protein
MQIFSLIFVLLMTCFGLKWPSSGVLSTPKLSHCVKYIKCSLIYTRENMMFPIYEQKQHTNTKCYRLFLFVCCSPPLCMMMLTLVQTQELTTSYSGAGNNVQIGTNDNTKKGLANRSNTQTPSRNSRTMSFGQVDDAPNRGARII